MIPRYTPVHGSGMAPDKWGHWLCESEVEAVLKAKEEELEFLRKALGQAMRRAIHIGQTFGIETLSGGFAKMGNLEDTPELYRYLKTRTETEEKKEK